MSNRPRNPRPDANQQQILHELNQLPSFDAWNISKSADSECPGDVLVLEKTTGRWGVFEIKTKTGKASLSQIGMSQFVPIVRTTEDILRWFGALASSSYGWDEEAT